MKVLFLMALFISKLYASTHTIEASTENEIMRALHEATHLGLTELTIKPKQSPYVKVGSVDKYESGDFIFLAGLSPTDKDEGIRAGDYSAIYPIVKYMNELRFRVTINLKASASDLKDALSNDRPTIIVWSGHGNPQGFYDANSEIIPRNIFKHASPSVYQFILSSCHGRQALDDVYHPPKSLKTWGWTDLTNYEHLKSFLNSDDWDAFINRKAPSVSGLVCLAHEDESFYINNGSTQLPGLPFKSRNSCLKRIFNSHEGFICNQMKDEKYYTISIPQNEVTVGTPYDELVHCQHRVNLAQSGKICRREESQNSPIRIISSSNNKTLSDIEFKKMDECIEFIFKAIDV